MNSFGEYLRKKREQIGLPLRKVAAKLDIDTSILSKIERGERTASKDMLPLMVNILEVQQKELETEFIKATILNDLGDLEFIKIGLEETINTIKRRKYL